MNSTISVSPEPPGSVEARALIQALDELQIALYPAESNHLVPVDVLEDPAVLFLGARRGGELVACGAVMRADDYGEIKRVFVMPQARGLGLAVRIMQALEEHLLENHIHIARLETGISQPEALGLYARLGYTRCGPFGDYTEDPLSVFMEKQLAPE